ncbi:MerR family transcriptional regulator [Streptomyces asoensis]|uniref:Transcriptional regulator n=1 Tax=Streptomyces asoensis TaxID=249586 RepID=A0ABQ3S7L8_9ACTN|nr:MerR family transcriptional regulator [Streptomyces asoensis]GGQ98304.1 transcriptional regulator [Streptomyces asoensis]GHI64122.1 transcriptional regulator [Streptomyces asoensis]
MTIETEEPALTVDELAARAGVTVRTVRFYGTKGLLPPPVIGPRRVGHYGAGHLARLALIEELRRQGLTLAAIERYLDRLPPGLDAHDLAVHRAVVASWAPDAVETVGREELGRRAGRPLGPQDVDRLTAMGVLEVADGDADGAGEGDEGGEGVYRVDAGLLRLGVRLLDVPLSPEAIRAARTVLLDHARAAAHELSRMLREEVPQGDAQAVRSLSAHMQPLVVQALLTAFQRSLTDELREWLGEPPADGSR